MSICISKCVSFFTSLMNLENLNIYKNRIVAIDDTVIKVLNEVRKSHKVGSLDKKN